MSWWDELDFGDLPDFGDVVDPGAADWGSLMGLVDEVGPEMVLDTVTGQLVDASTIDASEIGDYNPDLDMSQAAPVGPSSVSGSKSDYLRSLEAASIASTTDWGALAAKGLGALLKGIGGGAGAARALGAGAGEGLGALPPGVGLMSAPSLGGGASMAAGGGYGGGGGLQGLLGGGSMAGSGMGSPGEAEGVRALLSRLQAEQQRSAMQAPIPMEAPVKFTPLSIPGAAVPMAGQAAAPQRMSGLQKLLTERMG